VLKKEYPFGAIFSSTGGDALSGFIQIPCDFLPEGVIPFTFPVIPVGFWFKREDCPLP
jgi:hypothetical protein